jgi:DNA mismatch repair protein MutS
MPPIYDIYFQITHDAINKYGETTILLYQVGAFFEMYGIQDPLTKKITKSNVYDFTQMAQLNISTKDGDIVMAGFRDYSLDKYLKLATQNGYTAVVYTQNMTNPKAITRELYGVFSPGTFISFDTDTSKELSNNTVCIWLSTYTPLFSKTPQLVCGISSAHIFTGESCIFEYDTPFLMNPTTFDELERYVSVISPSEAIIISYLTEKETNQIIQYLGLKTNSIHVVQSDIPLLDKCQKETYITHLLSTFYGDESYALCKEFQMYPTGTYSLCYLLHFLQERNPDLVKKMKLPHFFNSTHRVVLANHTLKQLNIVDDLSNDGKQAGQLSSVAAFLNRCCTPMGRRMFYKQITNPTTNKVWLETEYEKIACYSNVPIETAKEVRTQLRTVKDLEKIGRQMVTRKVYPNTIFQMYESVLTIGHIIRLLPELPIPANHVLTSIQKVSSFLDTTFYIERCKGLDTITTFQDTIFKPTMFPAIDVIEETYIRSKTIFNTLHTMLNKMMQQIGDDTVYVKIHETEKSGVSLQLTKKRAETLKKCLQMIPTIEVSPDFIVKSKDIKFIKASGTMEEIEFPQLTTLMKNMYDLKEQLSVEIAKGFASFLATFELYEDMGHIIDWTILLDTLQSKTYISQKYNYCRPTICNDSPANKSFFEAKQMRHVLIEHIQQNEIYVVNDLALSSERSQHDGILVFGTNAVGKTSLIRAIGICIIMAQAGFYVPCSSFVYCPYKSIFSRILGNDNLFKGLSTFAVEMSELRVILKLADEHSLVLGDELCSGTEMESALSLFSAGLVELCEKKATFLFATHFHEITGYKEIQELTRLGLKHMTVQYDPSTGDLIYNRVLNDGQGSKMYGLEVCKSLYMEPTFLERAYSFRNKYFPEQRGELAFSVTGYNAKKVRGKCEICHKEIASETHHLAPQQLANERGLIDHFHKNHPANLAALCEACHLLVHSKDVKLVRKKTSRGYGLREPML